MKEKMQETPGPTPDPIAKLVREKVEDKVRLIAPRDEETECKA